MFGTSRKQLAWFAGSFSTMLDAGLPVTRCLDVLAGQAGGRLGGTIAGVRSDVEAGSTLAEAVRRTGRFPQLFVQLVEVGEQAGTLQEAMQELSEYYEFQQRLRRDFLRRIAFPLVEYVAAVAVVALATWIMGMVADRDGHWLRILVLGYGIPSALVVGYQAVLKPLGGTRPVHELLLHVPLVGRAMRSLALARFSLVMRMLLEAGVPVTAGLARACEATGNRAFAARGPRLADVVQRGGNVTEALRRGGVFPQRYLDIVEVAEESGQLDERFGWLADHHAERAESALKALAAGLGWLIWIAVAGYIVYMIFQIFSQYVGAINKAARGR
ncbi:MAG: type II secretion system F family protein [Planctomycetota bacterium]